jgi:hypothetical protein
MAHGATDNASRIVQGTIGLCIGLALLMLLGSMAKQGWLISGTSNAEKARTAVLHLRPMAADLSNDAFVRADHAYFANDPIAPITDRVAGGVRSALSKSGKSDRFAVRLHASWDHIVKQIARATDDPDDLRFALRPYFSAWMDDYIWLIRHAESLGFTFASLEDPKALSRSDREQLLFLRYDVHLRDIAPFYGILDANRSLELPSVAYLQWGYSDLEDNASADFLALRKFQSPSTRFGLHISPIPTILTRSKGGYRAYVAWLKGDGLTSLGDAFDGVHDWTSPGLLKRIRQTTDETISDFQTTFGDFRTMSLHGSEFDRTVRRYCKGRMEACELTSLIAAELFSSSAFADLRHDIIDRVVDRHGLKTVTDSTPAQTVVCGLQRAAAERASLVMLLHPAQFMRGRRSYRALGTGDDGLIDCVGSS